MTLIVDDPFITHRDETTTAHVHGGQTISIRKMNIELPGEHPLWVERSILPSGPTRPPVVLIHGFAQNRFSWDTQHRSMTAWLAQRGWDVWNLELRGHGRSRRKGGTKATTFADYPNDLLRLGHAMPQSAFWVGHSLGASVAYAAVAATPKSPPTSGVVGIAGLYRFGQAGWILPAVSHITRKIPLALNLGDIQVHTGTSGRVLSRLFPMMDLAAHGMPIAGWWPGSVEPALAKERMRKGFDYIPVRVWQEMASWVGSDAVPWDDGWRQATVPCCILLGDRDSMLYPEEGRAAFDRAGTSQKVLHIFDDRDGLTHWGHLDIVLGKKAPDHVWPFVHRWMEETTKSGPTSTNEPAP